jgi:hypothetical protein
MPTRVNAAGPDVSLVAEDEQEDDYPRYKAEGTPMLSTLPTVDVGAWPSPVSELDLEKKLAVQVIYSLRVSVIFSC